MQTYTIKPLVWKETAFAEYKATTMLKDYYLRQRKDNKFVLFCVGFSGKEFTHICNSLEEGYNKAQTHWEGMVRRLLNKV